MIDALFQFKYLKLLLLDKKNSLFWRNAQWENNDLFLEKVDFVLYIPNADHTDKDVYQGCYDSHINYKLPKKNAKGNKLQIFPKYFCYRENIACIYQIEFISVKGMQQCLLYLLQQPEIILKVFIHREATTTILDKLDKSIKTISSHQQDLVILKQKIYQKQQQDFVKHIDDLYDNQEQYLKFSLLIQITTQSKKELDEKLYDIKQVIIQYQGVVKQYLFEQKQAIELMYFNYKNTHETKNSYIKLKQAKKIFPIATLGLFDSGGENIGRDFFNNRVLFNLWLRTANRVNSNFIILGQSGMGKTTLLQTILQSQNDDVDIIIFDPENEYTHMFNEEGYKQYIVENEATIADYMSEKSLTSEQSNFLLQHFKLSTNCNYQEQQVFEGMLLEFRKNNKGLRFEEYIKSYFKENNLIVITQYLKNLKSKKKMTLQLDKSIHHFVLSSLLDITTVKLQIALFELLFHMWQWLMINPTKKKILVMDESYFVFNEDNYAVIELLRNIVKRARKYNVSIGLISQNLIDFRNPKLMHLLLPIIDNCTYKFIFRLGEFDMKEFTNLLSLENHAAEQLKTLPRGECLLVSGWEYGVLKVAKHETI